MEFNPIGFVAVIVACLVIGGAVSYGAFPKTEIETITEIEYINRTETITLTEEIEIEIFDAYLLRFNAWNFVLDENFYELRYCDDDKYKAHEIEWIFDDEFIYEIKDLDKNQFKVYFGVEGDYDNECEQSFNIEVSYYKNREPVVLIE